MASRRVKIDRHFDDLEEVYFGTRRQLGDSSIASVSRSYRSLLCFRSNITTTQFFINTAQLWFTGCLQLLEILEMLEIYWNLKTLLEILEISWNLMVPPANFYVR